MILKTTDLNNPHILLHSGDTVLLSGTFYTARDAAHKALLEDLAKGQSLPFDPQLGPIYYVGPTPAKEGLAIGSCGPTSSYRMDKMAISLMDYGIIHCLGKGPRSLTYQEALKLHHGYYFTVVGGIAAKLALCVKSSKIIAYPELGTEAIRELIVEDFPAIVAYDSEGHDIFNH